MEDLKENFVLLSKVAKEKKYAQEYLGLLARRGDIGSIRIGKRWYTTEAWFEEFLQNSQKKKEIVNGVRVAAPMQTEAVRIEETRPVQNNEIKINMPFVFPEREKVSVARPVVKTHRREENSEVPAKIPVAVKTEKSGMIGRKNVAGDIGGIREIRLQPGTTHTGSFVQKKSRQFFAPKETKFKKISVEERNRRAVPYEEIKFTKKTGVFSPDLSREERVSTPLFSKFAFAASFVIILFLVAASGYFIYSGGLLEKGKVAGVSDEKNTGLSGIKSKSEYFFAGASDKIKEAISVSRVTVEAVKEKSVNNDQ